MNKFHLIIILEFVSAVHVTSQEPANPRIIPVVLTDSLMELGFQQGDEVWVQVAYRPAPHGPIMHEEFAEKVWWVQDRAFVLLGATGEALPPHLLRRATVFVEIENTGTPIWADQVETRRGAMVIDDEASVIDALGKRLSGVDGSYLALVANYLAQNVATLDVQGSSYSIDGWGTVIDSAGDWTGGRLATLAPGYSVFVGDQAGVADDGSNNFNTGVGYEALRDNSSGTYNVALGSRAMLLNTSGSYNTAIGDRALWFNTTGQGNTTAGFNAMSKNTTGSFNTAYGYLSLLENTTGGENTAFGSQAMRYNEDGESNTAIGFNALRVNQDGIDNTALGHRALELSTGYWNTALGSQTLRDTTDGDSNTAVGYTALASNQSGSSNTAVGSRAMYSNETGDSNTAIGSGALYSNETGFGNVAVGTQALSADNDGIGNTAVGHYALDRNRGDHNTSLGYNALDSNSDGENNTAVGYYALEDNTVGTDNTAVGSGAMQQSSGGISRITAIGAHTRECSSCNLRNATMIGAGATGMAHDSVRLGDTLVTTIGGEVDWSTLSDGRFKTEITEDVPGLTLIASLRPVRYRVDRNALNRFLGTEAYYLEKNIDVTSSEVQTGFIAQEVQRVVDDLGAPFSGVDAPTHEQGTFGLRYGQFVVPLVKAVQEQQALIESQAHDLALLSQRLRRLETLIDSNETSESQSTH